MELETRMEYFAEGDDIVKRHPTLHTVVKRQSSNSGVKLNPDGTINMAAWEIAANTACTRALSQLAKSTNPSGHCICYNLPALNNQTGEFEADLRLYQLSQPTGDFAGIPPERVMVELSYNGAQIQRILNSTARQPRPVRRQAADPAAAPSPPVGPNAANLRLVQSYLFGGKIDSNRMTAGQAITDLEPFVVPVVTLRATNNFGQNVSTIISSNEAAFVTGVFSGEVILSDFARANLVVEALRQDMASDNSTVAFVLPGVQLMLFPIGLIITSIWLAIGLAVIGFGTYERIMHREVYRQRQARVAKGPQTTI